MNNSVNSRKLISMLLILILVSGIISVIYPNFIGRSSAQVRDHRSGICIPTGPRDHRCESIPQGVCIPTGPRDHRCETLSHPPSVAPPPGSMPPVSTPGNLEVSVSGDVDPNIVWTSPSDASRQKASIFFDVKIPSSVTDLSWGQRGCMIWRDESMRGAEVVPGHWERIRVDEFDQLQMLRGFWTRSMIDSSIYKSIMEAYFPVGTTRLGCTITYNEQGNLRFVTADFTVQVDTDDIPPTIITPTAIVEDSNSANGMVIEYEVNATDNSGDPVEVKCDPSSGSLFPIGKTSVTCNANDKFGNSIEKIFPVGILGNTMSGAPVINTSTGAEQQCERMEIVDVKANDFEDDTADYHPASDAVDGRSSTWWSNQGENSWLQIDLGDKTSLCDVTVEWNKGDQRKYTFEISASEDGNEFKKIFEGTNQKGSTSAESYTLDNAEGRYLKVTVTDTSSSQGWVSIREIGIHGEKL
jgi:F5/8 type C domain/HYR domain